MKTLLAFLCLAFVACSSVPTPEKNADGSVAMAHLVGGKGDLAYNADGSMHYTYNNEKSLQHVVQGITTLGTTGFAAWGAQAKTASDNAAAVKQAGIASKTTLGQQKLANDAAANAAKAANDQALIQAGHFKTP